MKKFLLAAFAFGFPISFLFAEIGEETEIHQQECELIDSATLNFSDEKNEDQLICASDFEEEKEMPPQDEKRWYIGVKPGYYYFTDEDMQRFFNNGAFVVRAETGYRFWGPFTVWIDASYLQKEGAALGGGQRLDIKLANITLGLKLLHSFNRYVSIYGGAGPRLFLLMLKNDTPYIRGDDNAIGIGAGFDAGLWIFPVPQWPNFFLDICADYSLKTMDVDEDELSSIDNDVDVSGLSATFGIGIRF